MKNTEKFTVPGSGVQETGFSMKFGSSEKFPIENAILVSPVLAY